MAVSRTIHVRTEAQTRELLVTRVADVEARPIEALWPGLLYRGKLAIIAGDPGLSKSTLASAIAATISVGGRWPLSDESAPIGDTLMLAAEDDIADTLRPRLEEAGADLSRIHCVQGVFDDGADSSGYRTEQYFQLGRHVAELDRYLRGAAGRFRLVVIDPISAYLSGTDAHKNAEVRQALQPLVHLAQDHDVAVLLVSHLNKAADTRAMYRISGSIAFTAVARTVLLVSRDPDEPDCRHLVVAKNNVGRDSGGLRYRVIGRPRPGYPDGIPRIEWLGASDKNVEDLVCASTPRNISKEAAIKEASDWLRAFLETGPKKAGEVESAAQATGIAQTRLHTASTRLGVQKRPSGLGGPWYWSLLPGNAG